MLPRSQARTSGTPMSRSSAVTELSGHTLFGRKAFTVGIGLCDKSFTVTVLIGIILYY